MIIDSHWRRLKYDFLHRINRPQTDLMVWRLTSHSIPKELEQIEAIQTADHRKAASSWRETFK